MVNRDQAAGTSMRLSNTPNPPTVVTYRLDDKMVYVTPPQNHKEALAYALEVFPEQLADISQEQITFSISVLVGKDTRTVQIGSMAWSMVMSTLSQFEIIDVSIQPTISVEDVPPLYSKPASSLESEEKPGVASPPSSRSPSPLPRGVKGWFGKRSQ